MVHTHTQQAFVNTEEICGLFMSYNITYKLKSGLRLFISFNIDKFITTPNYLFRAT